MRVVDGRCVCVCKNLYQVLQVVLSRSERAMKSEIRMIHCITIV